MTGGEDRVRSQPGGEPRELKDSEWISETSEGPVISSVFSLSSGSENVPEGIKWNSSTSKIKSIELLRRKIAQLIESCGKPSSLSANSARIRSTPKGTSKAIPEGVQVTDVPLPGPGPSTHPLQQPQDEDGVSGSGELPHQQIYPQFANGSDGNAESRGTRKARVATPVLIPKGAGLRVLNSSEDAHIVQATCDAPAGIPYSKAQLSKPAPSCPMKQTQTCSL